MLKSGVRSYPPYPLSYVRGSLEDATLFEDATVTSNG